jgi:hypothetical protein
MQTHNVNGNVEHRNRHVNHGQKTNTCIEEEALDLQRWSAGCQAENRLRGTNWKLIERERSFLKFHVVSLKMFSIVP